MFYSFAKTIRWAIRSTVRFSRFARMIIRIRILIRIRVRIRVRIRIRFSGFGP